MLTYPSDPLPQIVCPMDEDAISPNRFCSAPPHSEPPPPLLPLSSITPSCVNDGIPGHRRSGRIQGIKAQTPQKQSDADSAAAQKPPRPSPSPSKRQRQSGSMVQVSQCKQPRVDGARGHEKQNEDAFDSGFAAEHQNKQKDQKSVCAAENVAEQFPDDTAQHLGRAPSDMDVCGELAVGHVLESAAAPKGWVIGPLFQSFRSKMASFTEIVMSPVKLFRANSPPPSMDHPDSRSECELSEPSDAPHPEAQSENAHQDAKANQQSLSEEEGAQNAKPGAFKYSKRLSFDVASSARGSEQAGECAAAQKRSKPDSVPSQHSALPRAVAAEDAQPDHSSTLSRPSVGESASRESELHTFDEQKLSARLKPLQRKCAGSRRKVAASTSARDVKQEASEPEVTDVSHASSQTNKGGSGDNDKPLSSSASCAQADADCPQPDGDGTTESCHLVRQSLRNNLNVCANGKTLRQSLDTRQLETELNPKTHPAAGPGRAKRELKADCYSKDSVKRKRLTVDDCSKDTKARELVNVAPRTDAASTNATADGAELPKPPRKRSNVSTRANKRGKGVDGTLVTVNEAVLDTRTESSPDATSVCSLDKSSSVSEINPTSSSSKVKSCKRPRTKADLKPDANSMDLETTIAVTSTKRAEPEPFAKALARPDAKQLQSSRACRNASTKPVKRKSPNDASSATESESPVVSTSPAPAVEPPEVTPVSFNTSQTVGQEEGGNLALNQPSKRPKKGFRGGVKSSVSAGSQETKPCVHNPLLITKESQDDSGKISTDPVYFEMTPFESNSRPGPSAPQPHSDCRSQSDSDAKRVVDERGEGAASAAVEVFPGDAELGYRSSIDVSSLRSSARRVNAKPRRADTQRRKCRVLHSRTRKGDEVSGSVTMEDADLPTASARSAESGLSRRLLRSHSCPEIPSLRPLDLPWTSPLHSPQHSRAHAPLQHQSSHTPLVHHVHKSLRRARRHTVCSVEVEREIAPLCLRKEVYPSRRSVPYDSATQSLPPSTSLSALASCFLSSPLAFLSKKVDLRGAAASASASSPTASSSVHPLSPSTWRLSGFLQRNDPSSATMDSCNRVMPLDCEIERRQQSEEDDDCEDTSSSSQEFEDVALREEKSLSDSEIKVVQKHEERGKVSSIRIRKTLPKPQNNLTPMGLPRPIRLKKKEFSLEEIYTNKNFSKPPESRLETIFEVPLNRRNGSESWFGQRRLKRFLEFLEVGEVRKPKKPLVGVGKAAIPSSRTRRGGFPKDEAPLSVQDVDSLLCAKLDQLNLWLMDDQKDS